MTIVNAAILVGIAEPGPCVEGLGSAQRMPTFYTISCFDRSDRDECLRIELEDLAVAYSTGVEGYHRPIRVHQLPAPIHWKTLPLPFVCHVLL